MICCNTGARTRRLMMTRARFRAYGVHRVLWRTPGGPRNPTRERNSPRIATFPLKRSAILARPFGPGEPSLRFMYLDGDKEETPSKYYCMWKILSSRVSPLMHSCQTRPHVAGRTRVQYQTREQLKLPLTDEPSGYTSRLRNELQSCMQGREDLIFLWRRKDIQWSISHFLSFSLFLARASVHTWWDDELFQFDFHAHWRVSIICQLSLDTLLL